MVVIAAGGDLDATNAGCFVEYALRHIDEKHALVLDLRKLEFLGTEGFLALKTAWSYAHQRAIDCTLLPSAAVDRLLEIGDPECTVSTADSLREVLNRLALPRPATATIMNPRWDHRG
ncbi:STAS domain protein [Mycobacteroides abscessus subsp. bolletii 1513]|uniref:STAS domain protein n=1 Tax=Mycobacteroides abscessus subsp. bolletii 1513 TaxID=1299321 RepID=X8DIN0_9MYCO|nr:STAS domain protein [Mycobacteroides abscessus subsp. bolletii 1513]